MHRRNKYAKEFDGKDEPRLGRPRNTRGGEMDITVDSDDIFKSDQRIRELEQENAALKADAMAVEKKLLDEITNLSAKLERAESILKMVADSPYSMAFVQQASRYFEESKCQTPKE